MGVRRMKQLENKKGLAESKAFRSGGERIRTSEAYAADLQSAPFDRSGTPPFWCALIVSRFVLTASWK